MESDPPFDRPDPLWAISAGSGDGGRLQQSDLAEVAASWPRSGNVPEEVAWALSLTRTLWVQAWWRRDLLAVAMAWSFVAVERSFRVRVGDAVHPHASVGKVLVAARKASVIDASEEELLSQVFQRLRNPLAHGQWQSALTLGLAEGPIRRSHELVVKLFPE